MSRNGRFYTNSITQTYLNPIRKLLFDTIMQLTIDGVAAEMTSYIGVFFAKLMQTGQGGKLLEFNC